MQLKNNSRSGAKVTYKALQIYPSVPTSSILDHQQTILDDQIILPINQSSITRSLNDGKPTSIS